VVVSPDVGGVKRAPEFGECLHRPVAICVKRRMDGASVEVTQVIGDVRDRPCVIVDDMITTGSTVVEAARALRAHGARDGLVVVASHGLLVAGAAERMRSAGVSEVLVSDSIAGEADHGLPVTRVGIAGLLGEVVRRLMGE